MRRRHNSTRNPYAGEDVSGEGGSIGGGRTDMGGVEDLGGALLGEVGVGVVAGVVKMCSDGGVGWSGG